MGCDQSLKAIIIEKCRNEVGEEGMNIKDTLEENKYKSQNAAVHMNLAGEEMHLPAYFTVFAHWMFSIVN